MRLEFSRSDLLEDIDFQIPLGQQALEPPVVLLQLLQTLDVVGLQRAKTLAPQVDRLLAELVLAATSATGLASASRRILTICSSVNRLFFISSLFAMGAIVSSFNRSEYGRAGQYCRKS